MDKSEEQLYAEAKPTIKRIIARLAGVFLAPRKTLVKTAYEPGVWIPIIIVALFLAAVRLILLPDSLNQLKTEEFIQNYSDERGITKSQAQQEITLIRRSAPILTIVEAPLLVASGAAVVALIMFLIGKHGYKNPIRFIYVFRMIAWASVVSAVPLILSIPLKLINPAWDLPSSPAVFLPVEVVGTFFYNILITLDLFFIWQVWLISIGMSVLYKVPFQRAVSSVGTVFIIFIVLNVLFATQMQ